MIIILIGFKNCGKTTIGKMLAGRLGYAFIDTDELIIDHYREINNAESQTIRDIYRKLGEGKFRDLEQLVVASLSVPDNTIIAVGGGTVINSQNLIKLKAIGQLIYLQQDQKIIKHRIEAEGFPPFLRSSRSDFESLFTVRAQIYEKIADQIIDVSNKTHDEIIKELSDGK